MAGASTGMGCCCGDAGGVGAPMQFSGTLIVGPLAGPVPDKWFACDVQNGLENLPIQYPRPVGSSAVFVLVNVTINTSTVDTTFRVYRNGLATGFFVVVPALTTGLFLIGTALLGVAVGYGIGEGFDLELDNPGEDVPANHVVRFSATAKFS